MITTRVLSIIGFSDVSIFKSYHNTFPITYMVTHNGVATNTTLVEPIVNVVANTNSLSSVVGIEKPIDDVNCVGRGTILCSSNYISINWYTVNILFFTI